VLSPSRLLEGKWDNNGKFLRFQGVCATSTHLSFSTPSAQELPLMLACCLNPLTASLKKGSSAPTPGQPWMLKLCPETCVKCLVLPPLPGYALKRRDVRAAESCWCMRLCLWWLPAPCSRGWRLRVGNAQAWGEGKGQPEDGGFVPSQPVPPERPEEEEMPRQGECVWQQTAQREPTLSEQLLLMLELRGNIFCPLRRGWKSNVYPGREETAFLNMP